ncbi:eukaryotic translation initiation factor 4E1 [Drosophila erecta]|uniref:eIF-4F 25 kDa subunit n=1 Tax=Drosophila erecta TaxID=7220 RepID=B3P5N0_DROER|nr:eukaryotic translation initiation factor 4E1 [Drosophila erecta]EDV53280.1 uncharacterized protein Dere_GG12044 [Drosophila erecta]
MANSKQANEFLESKEGIPLNDDSLQGAAKKRKLQNTWTLWGVTSGSEISWEDNLSEIGSFNTVEDFWNLYYSTESPSKLQAGCDYMLFKKGIRPMWEDLPNKHGGRWTYIVYKKDTTELDIIWLDVLLCLIGEACDNSDQICGAFVRIRKKVNKVSVWTNSYDDNEAVMEIGQKLCEVVSLSSKKVLKFRQHQNHKPYVTFELLAKP